MPGHIIVSLDGPLSPTLKSPTLPPSPTAEEYRVARDIEKAKAEQALDRLERLKEHFRRFNDSCAKGVEIIHQQTDEVKEVEEVKEVKDTVTTSAGKHPEMPTSIVPRKRRSSLNGAAAPFVPTFARNGGNTSNSSNVGS